MSPRSPSDAHLRFRRAKPDESDALTVVAHDAKRHWGYRDEDLTAWRDDLTVAAETLCDLPTVVAEFDGQLAGFYQLSTSGAAIELEHFWVRPAYMGRGVGRALLEHAARVASEAGFRELPGGPRRRLEAGYRHGVSWRPDGARCTNGIADHAVHGSAMMAEWGWV